MLGQRQTTSFVSLLALLFIATPLLVSAATAFNPDCAPEKGMCTYRQCCAGQGKCKTAAEYGVVGKACKEQSPVGPVSGKCVSYGVCKAENAPGVGGQGNSLQGLSQLMSQLGQLMSKLGQGGGGGGGGGGGSSPTGGSQGCTQYRQVSTPTSDPCAYYVPGGSGSTINLDLGGNSNGGSSIGDLLGGSGSGSGGSNPISDLLGGLTGGSGATSSGGSNGGSVTVGGQGVGVSASTAGGATNLGPGGANGEIRVLPNGATIVITNQNNSGNSVTAGFLGTQSSFNGAPNSVVATWCKTRPWASNFLSFIVPATFFDSLCTLRGFQVGDNYQAGGSAEIGSHVNIQNPPPQFSSSTSGAQGVVPQSPTMQVDIWAVPPTVSLGGRTTIYWNSKNAATCVETSPDGSFSHNTISGGGQTVPLSGATTFTISCMAPDGTHATDDVVVRLSL